MCKTEHKEVKEKTIGVVDCEYLNIRAEASMESDVLWIVAGEEELVINEEESNDEWFKVTTEAGVEGYCMAKHVAVI